MRKITGRHPLEFARTGGVAGKPLLEATRAMAKIMRYAFVADVPDARAEAEVSTEGQQWLTKVAERLLAHCEHVLTVLELTS